MNKQEIEKYIAETMAHFRKIDKESTEKDFKWQEDYIRKHLYKKYNIGGVSMELIKSISYDQQEIINNILKLYNKGQPIDFDPCYNVGGFYRNGVVTAPSIKSDIKPLLPEVLQRDVRYLPYINEFQCIMFDPPFLAGGGSSGKMALRYGTFGSVEELQAFYYSAFISLQRALKNKGLLIVKCQDFVHGRKNYIMSNYVLNMARDFNFKVEDLFILLAKTRPTYHIKTQQHARKYHSYFIVLRKKEA